MNTRNTAENDFLSNLKDFAAILRFTRGICFTARGLDEN